MNKEEIKQEPNDGLIARILGGTPTTLHKAFLGGTNQKNAMTILNRGGVTANDKGVLNLKAGQVLSKQLRLQDRKRITFR